MPTLSVKADFSAAKRALMHAHDDVVRRAAVAALNRAIISSRHRMTQEIRRYRSLRAGTIKQAALPLRRASFSRLMASMTVLFHAFPLMDYHVHAGKRGVTAQVIPDNGYRPIANAFQVARFGSQIFVRRGRSRGPLKMLYGPNLPSLLKRPAVGASLTEVAGATFRKRFAHELQYRLRALGFMVSE